MAVNITITNVDNFLSALVLSFKLILQYLYMQKIRTDLIKISTYAKQMGVSTTWVYKQAKQELIDIVTIDGVKFVKLKQNQ